MLETAWSDAGVAVEQLGLDAWIAPVYPLVRLAHILSMAAFFGGILLLDLRLLGVRAAMSFSAFSAYVLPYVIGSLAVAMGTGVLLFLNDPVAVAARPYFPYKMALIGLAVLNALVFQVFGHGKAAASRSLPRTVRSAGAASLALWFGVIVCACFNKLGPAVAPGALPFAAQLTVEKAPPAAVIPVTVRDKRDWR
ncbi:MAG: hypothetical protein NW215_15490 [Hyphomicrobiales bacterium]|nr:hypothetical protein [Hyphomicrobiales bacterium]